MVVQWIPAALRNCLDRQILARIGRRGIAMPLGGVEIRRWFSDSTVFPCRWLFPEHSERLMADGGKGALRLLRNSFQRVFGKV